MLQLVCVIWTFNTNKINQSRNAFTVLHAFDAESSDRSAASNFAINCIQKNDSTQIREQITVLSCITHGLSAQISRYNYFLSEFQVYMVV